MAYNEADSLSYIVREIASTLQAAGRQHEILIVDDGSRDRTGVEADQMAREHSSVRVVHHDVNRGLGGVYRTGYDSASGDLLSFFPADGQFPACNIDVLLARVEAADLVLGFVSATDSLAGRFLGRMERFLYRALFGALPRFQGVFMARASRLRTLALVSEGRGWAIVMEMIVRAVRAGWPIVSVETSLRSRQFGSSKVRNLRSILANLRQLAELRAQL